MKKIILIDIKTNNYNEIEPRRINVFVGNSTSGKDEIFQRLKNIFSEKNDTIFLKNPENNLYPPDIKTLAYRISVSQEQFFIMTNSPYLLTDIIENNSNKDIAINIVYKDRLNMIGIKLLSDKELNKVAELDCDFFFNLENFI